MIRFWRVRNWCNKSSIHQQIHNVTTCFLLVATNDSIKEKMIEILKIADDVRSLVDFAGNQFSDICAYAGNSCLNSGLGRVGDNRFCGFALWRYRNKHQENCFKDLMLVLIVSFGFIFQFILLVLDIHRHTSCLPKSILFGICIGAGLKLLFSPSNMPTNIQYRTNNIE